eukprot:gene58073-biopygen33416
MLLAIHPPPLLLAATTLLLLPTANPSTLLLPAAESAAAHQPEVLLDKLKRTCGITGQALELLRDYLQDRTQRMLMETGKSSWKKSPWGVPQGSVLGPLLFALFCADIADAVTEATLVQFADDVTLCVVARTGEEAMWKMNKALQQFEEYASGNRLAAEPTKTQLMMCTTRKRERQVERRRMPNDEETSQGDGDVFKTRWEFRQTFGEAEFGRKWQEAEQGRKMQSKAKRLSQENGKWRTKEQFKSIVGEGFEEEWGKAEQGIECQMGEAIIEPTETI